MAVWTLVDDIGVMTEPPLAPVLPAWRLIGYVGVVIDPIIYEKEWAELHHITVTIEPLTPLENWKLIGFLPIIVEPPTPVPVVPPEEEAEEKAVEKWGLWVTLGIIAIVVVAGMVRR